MVDRGIEQQLRSFPKVAGRCPACEREALMLANGGHVTCSLLGCPEPGAADAVLHGEAATRRAKEVAIAVQRDKDWRQMGADIGVGL